MVLNGNKPPLKSISGLDVRVCMQKTKKAHLHFLDVANNSKYTYAYAVYEHEYFYQLSQFINSKLIWMCMKLCSAVVMTEQTVPVSHQGSQW